MDPRIGSQVDQYQILDRLGQGAMGEVYLARHQLLDQEFAIKLLHTPTSSPLTTQRFLREMKAEAEIVHPNVVRVLYSGATPSGELFLVMELLRRESLASVIARGPLPPSQVLPIARQIAAGLAEIHRRGLVHRDLKPSNVMLVPAEGGGEVRAKILDLGLVRHVEPRAEDLVRTQDGHLLGTPIYMAPEAFQGLGVDQRADLYSFGIMLYEMLAGHPPFTGDLKAVMWKHNFDPPPPLAPAHGLEQLVVRLLAKEPGDRLPDGATLERVLVDLPHAASTTLQMPRVRRSWAKRRWWIAAAIALAVASTTASAAAWWLRGGGEPPIAASPLAAPPSLVIEPAVTPPAEAPVPAAAVPARSEPRRAPAAAPPKRRRSAAVSSEPAKAIVREVNITSEPPGASVELGGGRLGLTPLTIVVDQPSVQVTLRMEGYRDRTVTIAGSRRELHVPLIADGR